MKLLAALALPVSIVLAALYADSWLAGEPQPPPRTRATAIVWGGRVFADRRELARWLRARGLDDRAWARRHPVRARLAAAASDVPASAPPRLPGWRLPLAGAAAVLLAVGLLGLRRRSRPWSRRVAATARTGARAFRSAAQAGRASCGSAGSAVLVAWYERRELGWYLAGALLVAGAALLATAWH